MGILKITASSLDKDIDSAVSAFTKTIEKLQTTATLAREEKNVKLETIASLQKECSDLESVAVKAEKLNDKIKALLE